jgi:hypothetical protein
VTYTDTGLTNGQTYYYNISAVNAVGEGAKTTILSSTPFTVPGVPMGLNASASIAQITLTWIAPSNTGGSSILRYNVYRGLTESTLVLIGNSTAATYVDATGSAGTTYYFKVSAINAAGESSQAAAVSVIMPSLLPLSGKIVDENGNGLAGITVALEDGTTVLTDTQGNFTLMASPGNHTLVISGPGIETKHQQVFTGTTGLELGSISTSKASDATMLIVAAVAVLVIVALLVVMLIIRKRRSRQ